MALKLDRVLNKQHFYKKVMQKNVHQELVLDLFLIVWITQNSHYMLEIILDLRYFERGLLKSLTKVNFIFSFEPSPF